MEDIREKLSLVNKVVRVVDSAEGIDNSGIISFMYPNFIPKDEIFFDYENNILFTGKYKSGIREELAHGTKNFIALSNVNPDIDFTDRETIVRVLYNRWNKVPSEQVLGILVDNMNEYEFWDYFKKFWILGRSSLDEKVIPMYELHDLLGKQRYDILKKYLEMREVYSDSTIFTSVLGFIEKAMNPDMVSSKSGLYLKKLNAFKESYGKQIVPIIQRVYVMKGNTSADKEYRTLWLLMQLGKGNAI